MTEYSLRVKKHSFAGSRLLCQQSQEEPTLLGEVEVEQTNYGGGGQVSL